MKTNARLFLWLIALSLTLSVGCSESDTPVNNPSGQTDPDNTDNDSGNTDDPDTPGPDDPIKDGTETVDVPHYILSFYKPAGFVATSNDNLTLEVAMNLKSNEDYDFSYYDFHHAEEPEKYPEEATLYNALCERYGDMSYTEVRKFHPFYMTPDDGYVYPAYSLTSIEIRSIVDYDAAHPAGTLLNDLCEVTAWSPRDYIASGYTDLYDWSVKPEFYPESYDIPTCVGVHPVYFTLSEYTPADLVLLGTGYHLNPIFVLHFTQAPDAGNSLQRFLITLTDESGATYEVESDPVEWE